MFWLTALVFFAILGIGLYIIEQGKYFINLAKESVNWPEAEATVLKSHLLEKEIVTEKITGKPKSSYKEKETTKEHFYTHVFLYEYRINGVRFTNNKMTFEDYMFTTQDKTIAELQIEAYEKGSIIMIKYNPNDHKMSLIHAGDSSYGKHIKVGGYFVCALTLIFPVFYFFI